MLALRNLLSFFHRTRQGCVAANAASASEADFRLETAANDFKPDDKGWFQVAPYGEFKHSKGLQVFERADADKIVTAYNAGVNKSLGEKMFGLPLFIGHPDADKATYPDDKAYGRIKELEARNDGLWGKLKLNKQGQEIIEQEQYSSHSPFWQFRHDANRRGAIRPEVLISAGLTNNPNIKNVQPIAANEENNMNEFLKKLAKLLGLGEAANEADIETAVTTARAAANELPGVKTKLTETEGLLVAANAAPQKATDDLTAANTALATEKANTVAANGKVTTLTGERDTAANALKTERAARTKLIVDTAINAGAITQADKAGVEAELTAANSDAAYTVVADRVTNKAVKLFTKSISQARTAANGRETSPEWTAFNSRVEEIKAKKLAAGKQPGTAYNEAYLACKQLDEFKPLFDDQTGKA